MTRTRAGASPLRPVVPCLLAILLATSSAFAQSTAERMDALVSKYHEYGLFNGVVLVAENGEPVYEEAVGYAVMEFDVPNATDTRFRIGSVTKQFTAALVLQLVEEGTIDLDATISEYLPEYPPGPGEQVTIHQLLAHTSGIPSYTGFPEMEEFKRDPFDPDSFIATFWDRELEFEPGSRWSYNNSGYYLLGVILERVTGKPYARLLEERILDPLGLDDTGYDHYPEVIENMALGYQRVGGAYENADYLDTNLPYSAGMMYSTVGDLLKWDQELYGDGPFQQASTTALYFAPHAEIGQDGVEYAYGWFLHSVPMGADTVRAIEHGGGIDGFSTAFWRFPDQRRTVIVLDNTRSSETDDIARSLARLLYGQEVEQPKRPIADALARIIDEEGVEAAIARYRELKETAPEDWDFDENQLNSLGYRYLGRGDVETAIAIFELNVEMFPEAFNPWDSLAEAYMEAGDREKAIEYYRKSLELNPANENAKRMLRERLGVEVGDTAAEVPAEVLERYVGSYELTPSLVLVVTLENGELHGQATGQPKFKLVPTSETAFVVEGVNARLAFETAGDRPSPSVTLLQGGREIVGSRVE